jgi:hypothetical protein
VRNSARPGDGVKNDQAFVEQKNGAVVRRVVGYRRLEGLEAATALMRLYTTVRLFVKFSQPSFKLAEKHRDGARVRKRYHPPATPCQRLLVDPRTPQDVRDRVTTLHASLDPVPPHGWLDGLAKPCHCRPHVVFVERWRRDEVIKSVRSSSLWAAPVDRLGLLAEGDQQLPAEFVGLHGLGSGSTPKMMAKAAIASSGSGAETSMRSQIRAVSASSHLGQIHTRPVRVR